MKGNETTFEAALRKHEAALLDEVAEALAHDGNFDRWMRMAHLDNRNDTENAKADIRAFLAAVAGGPS